MKCDKETMLLYAVTDRAWVGKQSLYEQVEAALKGGVTCVQLREKKLDEDEFLAEAIEIAALCKLYDVPFFINDNVDISYSEQYKKVVFLDKTDKTKNDFIVFQVLELGTWCGKSPDSSKQRHILNPRQLRGDNQRRIV